MKSNNLLDRPIKYIEITLQKKWFFWLTLTSFCFYSFLFSIEQGKFNYDGYHWGLVASNANDFLNGKMPYRDFFVHYGFLTLFFQTIALKIHYSVFSLIFLSAALYVLSIVNIALILKKISSLYYCYFFLFILFFFQPYAVYPWHTYFIYFFISLGILFYFNKSYISLFIFGLSIQLCFLSSESFKICSYLISISTIILLYFEKKKDLKKFTFFSISYFLGFLIPLLIFILFLKSNGIYNQWTLHKYIPQILLETVYSSYYDLIKNFLFLYFSSFKNLYDNSFYLFGLILNLFCIFYIFKIFYNKNRLNIDITLVALIALFLNYMLVFKFNSFRLFCGPILGYIVYAYVVSRSQNVNLKFFSVIIIFFLALLSNPFEKNEANRGYVYKSIKNESLNNNKILIFENMHFQKNVWKHFDKIFEIKDNIKKNCSEIKYFYNLTSDHFYYLLMSNDFKVNQKVPGYSETKLNVYYNKILKTYDKKFYEKIKNNVINEDLIFIRENKDKPYLKILNKKIDIKNFYFIDLPFSFDQKKKKIYIPKRCII